MRKVIFLISLMLSCLQFVFAQTPEEKEDSKMKRHMEMMKIIMTKPKEDIKTIGVYVYDGFNTLDAVALIKCFLN